MLKQALQPSIDNVSIEWKVPSADVSQIPTNLPPIFCNSSLIVFGIPRRESARADGPVECEATVSYQEGKETRSLPVHFTLPPMDNGQTGDEVDAYPLHRLAGKQLLREVTKVENNKKELIRVSLEVGVVCKETALVAVSEGSGEVVSGTLQSQTVSVPTRRRHMMMSMMAQSQPMLLSCDVGSRAKRARRLVQHYAAEPSFASMPSSPAASVSGYLACAQDLASSKLQQLRQQQPQQVLQQQQLPQQSMSMQHRRSRSNEDSSIAMKAFMCSSDCSEGISNTDKYPTEACRKARLSTSIASTTHANHLATIALQQFSGAWHLNEDLAKICGRSLSDLRSSLPASLSSLPDNESVWATLLAVALLERQVSAKDEWELCVEKAMIWLRNCLVSAGDSVENLLAIAEAAL